MSLPADRSGPVRPGEELDMARLAPYLKEHILGLEGPLELKQFRSGHSNLTYLVKAPHREVVLRRPPFGSKVKSAHDMGREYAVLSRLHRVYRPAPEPLLYCDDESIVGAPFYVMERITGLILRTRPPEGYNFDERTVRRCCESLVDNLAALHGLDYRAAGLEELRKPGQYVERQVHGWTKRYHGSQTDEIPEIEAVARWLAERIPADTDAVLIHNDYKFDNIVLDPGDPTRIIGVLDWEMATIGDPLADLGTSLSYWIEPTDAMELQGVQCFLTLEPGAMSRRELADAYGRRTGRDTSNILYYYVLGVLKLAVIVQQIYYRYAQGLTRDERFAPMIGMVRLLARKGAETIDSGRM
jgi:aminoglycoside phosphotransferase (APT) family kinase protein